jgi:hypothetical protein
VEYLHTVFYLAQKFSAVSRHAIDCRQSCAAVRKDKTHLHWDTRAETSLDNTERVPMARAAGLKSTSADIILSFSENTPSVSERKYIAYLLRGAGFRSLEPQRRERQLIERGAKSLAARQRDIQTKPLVLRKFEFAAHRPCHGKSRGNEHKSARLRCGIRRNDRGNWNQRWNGIFWKMRVRRGIR